MCFPRAATTAPASAPPNTYITRCWASAPVVKNSSYYEVQAPNMANHELVRALTRDR